MAVICVSVTEVFWCECTEFHLGEPCGAPVLDWEISIVFLAPWDLEPHFTQDEDGIWPPSLTPSPSLSAGAPARRPPTTQQNSSFTPMHPPAVAALSRVQKRWRDRDPNVKTKLSWRTGARRRLPESQ